MEPTHPALWLWSFNHRIAREEGQHTMGLKILMVLWPSCFLLLLSSLGPGVLEASLVAQRLKHLLAMWETWVRSLSWEDPLEKEMATHSSILAWRIPWTEEPGGLQSTGSQRVGHDWATSLTHSLRRWVKEHLAMIYVKECSAYVFHCEFYSFWPYIEIFNLFCIYLCMVSGSVLISFFYM